MSEDRKDSEGSSPKLYSELAPWWPLLSPPSEYAEEAGFFQRALVEACDRLPRTLLELGSGGGSNASHLKSHFEMTLVDVSAGMLEVSRALNPECEHVEGDMRTVRLGRQFDCVFVHDAVGYMTSASDLRRAIDTAFAHCKPGGAALFTPDYIRENFHPSTEHGGYDDGPRGLRFLEWAWDPEPADTTYVVDYACVLRSSDGSTRVVHDRHLEGLFFRAEWLGFLSEAGFQPAPLRFEHTGQDSTIGTEGFLGRKPAGTGGG